MKWQVRRSQKPSTVPRGRQGRENRCEIAQSASVGRRSSGRFDRTTRQGGSGGGPGSRIAASPRECQGKKKRRDPGQVPSLFGPAGRGVPGTCREGEGVKIGCRCQGLAGGALRSLAASTEWTPGVAAACHGCGDTVECGGASRAVVRARAGKGSPHSRTGRDVAAGTDS